MSAENQPTPPVPPNPAAPVRQEEGEWAASFRGRDYIVYSGEREILRVKDAVEETIAAVDDLILAFNASLRDKTEQEKTEQNYHRRWNIEQTPDGFRICKGEHDKSQSCEWIELVVATEQTLGEPEQQDRLAAETEANVSAGHVAIQKALKVAGDSNRYAWDKLAEIQRLLSEHAPKSASGSELPEADITLHETRYQRSSTSDGSGLPEAKECDHKWKRVRPLPRERCQLCKVFKHELSPGSGWPKAEEE